MKQKLLNLKSWLLMMCLLVGVGQSWAAEQTVTWTVTGVNTAANGAAVNTTLKASKSPTTETGVWTAVSADKSFAGANQGAQLGSGSYSFNGTITLSNTSIPSNATIKKVVVTCKSGGAYTVDVKVGGTQLGSSITVNSTTAADKTFSGSLTGNNIVIDLATTAKKYFNVSKIAVTYDAVVAQYSYTLETFGSGTTTFKDGNGNAIVANQKINSGTKITPTFTPADGYEFTSWEYYSTAGEWKTLDAKTPFTITKDVKFRVTYTAVAPKAKYPVTIQTPENGTLTIKDGETVINSGDEVEEGTELTIECTPANADYRFKNWQYKEGEGSWNTRYTNPQGYTMPSANVQFRANFELIPTYTVAWSVNGAIVKSEDLKDGAAVTAPADPEDINNKTFTGWVTTSTVDADKVPTYVTPSATATEDVTYYAVFADVTKGNGDTKTDVMTQEWTTSTGTSYIDWFDKTLQSGAKYSGRTAGGNSSIQLRNNSSAKTPTYDGIITTESGGKAKKITVVWNGNTLKDRTLNVYGKNEAYSAVKDIFDDSKCGTLIGQIVCGTTTEITINQDYEFIALRSDASAMFLNSISIDWLKGSSDVYSDFTTTPEPSVPTYASLEELIDANLEEPTVVNVTIDDVVAMAMVNPVSGAYMVSLKNSGVTLAAPGSNLGWKNGGTVSGTLENVKWYPDDFMLTSETDYWSSLTYDYSAPSYDGTIDFVAAGEDGYYATFSSEEAVTIPAYFEVNDEYVYLSVYSVYAVGDMIELQDLTEGLTYDGAIWLSENEGYLIKAESTSEEYNFTGETAISVGYTNVGFELYGQDPENFLRPSSESMSDSNNNYKLAYKSGSNQDPATLGFYWGAANGGTFALRDNSAYLALPKEMRAKGFSFVEIETTGIKNANTTVAGGNVMYNLAGQRVNKNAKGIVIINGKKMLNK